MRISRFLAVAVLAFGLTACSDATAPNPQTEVHLPPFDSPTMTMGTSGQYIQILRFYAPPGVAPETQVEITNLTASSPKLRVSKQIVANEDDCFSSATEGCARVPWMLFLIITAEAEGEAKVSVSLKAKPQEISSIRIKVEKDPCYNNCKG